MRENGNMNAPLPAPRFSITHVISVAGERGAFERRSHAEHGNESVRIAAGRLIALTVGRFDVYSDFEVPACRGL